MSTDILGWGSFVTSRQGRLDEKTRTASEKSAKAGAKSCLDALFVLTQWP
jgi:hypothetical protein